MNITTDQQYITRDRSRARIYATDGGGHYPIHGAVHNETDGTWDMCEWTNEGTCWKSGAENEDDLVEVVDEGR